MSTKNLSDPNPEAYSCPAKLEWWDANQFDAYYRPSKAEFSGLDIHTMPIKYIDCPKRLPDPQIEGSDLICQYRDQTWKNVPLEFTWQLGQFSTGGGEKLLYVDHWHTSFDLDQNHIHIDYIDGPYGHPQVCRREYRVFSNGQEIGRGGGMLGFILMVFGSLRNYPLVVTVDDYLIYLSRVLQGFGSRLRVGEINPENVLSVWKKV